MKNPRETSSGSNGLDLLRRRLMLGVPGGLVLASPLALVACGGGGGGGDDDTTPPPTGTDPDQARATAIAATLPTLTRSVVATKVTLPAAIASTLTRVRLVSANNVSEIGDNGNAGVVVIEGAPQMSYAIGPDGNLLLMSAVEGGGRTTVDSRSTAEALLTLTTEAYDQGPAIEIALRRALADPRFDAVVEPVRLAVEAAASRNGIDAADTALMAALQTATLALRGKSAVPRAKGRVRAQAVTVTPAGTESGVTVIPTDDFDTVKLRNQFRRRAHAWISRTGSYDASGAFTPVTPPVPVSHFALDATAALSFDGLVASVGDYLTEFYADLGFLGEYESSASAWQPVESGPVQLPFAPDSAEVAQFTARVVGPGATANGTLSTTEQDELDRIWWATFIDDIAKPFLRTIVLPMTNHIAASTWSSTFDQARWALVLNGVTDLSSLAVGGQYFPATLAAIRGGDATGAFTGFLTEFCNSNTLQGLFELGLKAYTQTEAANPSQLRDSSGNVIAVNLVRNDLAKFDFDKLTAALTKLTRIVIAIRAAATVGDFAAIAYDWNASARLSEFTMNTSKAKVSLSPKPLTTVALSGNDGKATVTATIEGLDGKVPAESVFLAWTCTAKYGDLYRIGGNGIDTFESLLTQPSHDYIPTGVQDDPADPDVITVTAFYRSATTNQRIEMGSARTTVEFRKEFNLKSTPVKADLQAGGAISVSARLVEPLPFGATVRYEWLLKTGTGSLVVGPAGNDFAVSLVTYNAPASSDTTALVQVTATVTLPGGRVVKTNPATSTVSVKKGVKTLEIEGNWVYEPGTKPLATPSCFIDAAGSENCHLGYLDDWVVYQLPKVSGALSYSIRLLDSRGGVRTNYGFPTGQYSTSILDAGGLLRIKYWAADGPYGSANGVSNYPQTEANAMAYLLSRVATDGPRIVATVTVPG